MELITFRGDQLAGRAPRQNSPEKTAPVFGTGTKLGRQCTERGGTTALNASDGIAAELM
jgi:hypothetical protein